MMAVAAASSVPMINSSSRSRIFMSIAGPPGIALLLRRYADLLLHRGDDVLADAGLDRLVGRGHRLRPLRALLLGRRVNLRRTCGDDRLHRLLVLLARDRVGIVGRLLHRFLE